MDYLSTIKIEMSQLILKVYHCSCQGLHTCSYSFWYTLLWHLQRIFAKSTSNSLTSSYIWWSTSAYIIIPNTTNIIFKYIHGNFSYFMTSIKISISSHMRLKLFYSSWLSQVIVVIKPMIYDMHSSDYLGWFLD